jgi:myo-inositol-1(or 4)-monophosphatase
MTGAELERALEAALEIARHAGALLREGQERGFSVDHKGAVDLVTDYDLRSEQLVVDALRAAFPGHAILAEEGGLRGEGSAEGARRAERSDQRQRAGAGGALWLVDPLDGTTNYTHRLPFYCVSIALELAGELELGVVLAPALDWEFCARRGGGARLNGKPIRVSDVPTLDGALLATGFPYDRRTSLDNNVPQFSTMLRRAQGIRRVGAAALDCAMVAWGVLDGYWEYKLHPWDIAAGSLLVREAGGRVTDAEGGPHDAMCTHITATNGKIHEELLEVLRQVPRPTGEYL